MDPCSSNSLDQKPDSSQNLSDEEAGELESIPDDVNKVDGTDSEDTDTEIKENKNKDGDSKKPITFFDKPFVGTVRVAHGTTNFYGCAFNQFIKCPDEQIIAVVGGKYVNVYACPLDEPNIRVLMEITLNAEPEEDFYSVAWCCETVKDEKKFRMVAGGSTGRIFVFDSQDITFVRSLIGGQLGVNDIRTSPINPTLIAVACVDNSIRVYDIRAEASLLLIGGAKGHRGNVLSVDWSPDGMSLVASGYDHRVTKWDLSADDIQKHLKACNDELDQGLPVSTKNFPSSDPILDDVRTIYDLKGYTKYIHVPAYYIDCLHFDPVDCIRYIEPHPVAKQNFIFTKACGIESRFVCWDFGRSDGGVENVDPGQPRKSHNQYYKRPIIGGESYFNKFGLDPLRKWLAVGGGDGTCQFFYLSDQAPDNKLPQYKMQVTWTQRTPRQIAFSDEGRIVMMVGDKGLIARMDQNDFDNPRKSDVWGRRI